MKNKHNIILESNSKIILRENLSTKDNAAKFSIITFSIITILILFVLIGFIIYKSVPALNTIGFFNFIFKGKWNPSFDGDKSASYGISRIIISTVVLLIFSMIISVPITIFGSLYICEYLGEKAQRFFKNLIQLLAGIPSVVFGLFALDQIGTIFMSLGAQTRGNLMTASVTLAVMALPTMMTLSIDAIESISDGYRFASLGLGVTKEKTTFNVILKAASPKIVTAIITGMSRIVGETMAVILIAGNSPSGLVYNHGATSFFFSQINTLSSTIGIEMLENSGSMHESALYAIGLVLFFIVIIINLGIMGFSKQKKYKKLKKAKNKYNNENTKKVLLNNYKLKVVVRNYAEKKFIKQIESSIYKFFMITSLLIVATFVFWILGTIFVKGIEKLEFQAFVTIPGNKSGIFATLLVSLFLVFATLTFAIPAAFFVSLYLAEYSSETNKLTKFIRFAISILSSTPSIIFGVFGFSLFIKIMHIPMSVLAASITMFFVVLPSMITIFEDSIKSVPSSYKEAGYGMGLGKTKVIWKIILPSALKGMITGLILTISRIIGESAPVYLTLGSSVRMPGEGFLSSGSTLTTEIYMLVSEGTSKDSMNIAYSIALFTLILILFLNWLSHYVSDSLGKNVKIFSWKEKMANMKFLNIKLKKYFIFLNKLFINFWKKIFSYLKLSNIKKRIKRNKELNKQIRNIKKEISQNGKQ